MELSNTEEIETRLNDVAQRLVSVTDDILKEQLSDEYNILMDEFQMVKSDEKKQKIQNRNELKFNKLKKEYAYFDNTMDAFSVLNTDIESQIKQYRLPTNIDINDRRRLKILADALNITIHIRELNGVLINTIGIIKLDIPNPIYTLYKYEDKTAIKKIDLVKKQ